jgi:phage terminase large subunit-like protein
VHDPGHFKVKNLYLIDLLRRRIEYPELKRELHSQHERFRPSVVLIENEASGTQLTQELIALRAGWVRVDGDHPAGAGGRRFALIGSPRVMPVGSISKARAALPLVEVRA